MIINKWLIRSLLIGASASAVSCSGTNENKTINNTEVPVTVTVGTPSNSMASCITLGGHVEAVETANISTRMMGFITHVYVKTGDKVHKGQMLFSINNEDIRAKISQADAAVAQADAVFSSAQKDFERYTALFKKQSASAKELDNITQLYKSSKAGLDAARQISNEVNAQLSYTNVTAPFDGIVTQKFTDAGNMATPGMPVVSIESNGAMQIVVSVPETQISHVKVGADALMTVSATGSSFNGKVSEISSSSQGSGGLYLIKIKVPEKMENKLLAGMYVNVSISGSDMSLDNSTIDEVTVPLSSIVHKGELDGIYTVSVGNQALLRWVRLGKIANGNVALLSGLGKLEQFIVNTDERLYNGVPVKIAK